MHFSSRLQLVQENEVAVACSCNGGQTGAEGRELRKSDRNSRHFACTHNSVVPPVPLPSDFFAGWGHVPPQPD